MNKLVASLLAVCCFTAHADDWSVNSSGVPVVSENRDTTKVMALYGVCDDLIPTIVLGDLNLTEDYIDQKISFKVRIDKGAIYDTTAQYFPLSKEMIGVAVQMDDSVFKALLNGNTIRFQFPAANGSKIVEAYTLKGITQAYSNALMQCDSEYFEFEQTPQNTDEDYFESL